MSILITGSGGQLGREWVDFLKKRDVSHTACNSHELDITDRNRVYQVLDRVQPEIVVNCAAYTKVDKAETEIEKALLVNKNGVAHLADWCADNHARMVHFSTDYVFPGKKGDIDLYPQGYPEYAETDPVNNYGRSKRAGEEILLKSGIDFLLVRVSWLCGQYGKNFVKTMLKLGREKDHIRVVHDQMSSPSYTNTVVLYCYQILETGRSGIFHVSSDGLISWYDFAVEIMDLAGLKTVVEPISSDEYPTKAPRPVFSKLDSTKISKLIGVEQVDWKKELNDLIIKMNINL